MEMLMIICKLKKKLNLNIELGTKYNLKEQPVFDNNSWLKLTLVLFCTSLNEKYFIKVS